MKPEAAPFPATNDAPIPAYETLRQQVLCGQLPATRGLFILLTGGLSAFITAGSMEFAATAMPVTKDSAVCPQCSLGNVELIHLLCDMTRPHYAAQELP